MSTRKIIACIILISTLVLAPLRSAADDAGVSGAYSGVYRAITESEWTQTLSLEANGKAFILTESWDPDGLTENTRKKITCSWSQKLEVIELRCDKDHVVLRYNEKLIAQDLTDPPHLSGPALTVSSISTKVNEISVLSAKTLWREDIAAKILDQMYETTESEIPKGSSVKP